MPRPHFGAFLIPRVVPVGLIREAYGILTASAKTASTTEEKKNRTSTSGPASYSWSANRKAGKLDAQQTTAKPAAATTARLERRAALPEGRAVSETEPMGASSSRRKGGNKDSGLSGIRHQRTSCFDL